MTSWLDVMPVIPLAYSVPMTCRVGPPGRQGIAKGIVNEDCDIEWRSWYGREHADPIAARVDLSGGPGFAHALQRWAQESDDAGDDDVIEQLMWRHLRGHTTDADRLELANGLAEALR